MSQPSLNFAQVFTNEVEFVARSLLRFGVQRSDVEDVTQDVFVIVARKLPEFDTQKPLRGWLWGIVRRVASDYRALARHRVRPADDHPSFHQSGDERSESSIIAAREMVHAALARLPDERREVIILYEMEEMTLAEIAESLGIPLNTVASRLRRAREEFAEAVHELSRSTLSSEISAEMDLLPTNDKIPSESPSLSVDVPTEKTISNGSIAGGSTVRGKGDAA